MAKTKMERIAGIEAEIKQLQNLRKRLLQQQKEQERKVRARRLIERGAILESLLGQTSALHQSCLLITSQKPISVVFDLLLESVEADYPPVRIVRTESKAKRLVMM